MKTSVGRDNYRVYWYDADVTGTVKASAVCNYLQESALRHAVNLGFGFEAMKKHNQVWVIISFKVEMSKLPLWGEQIQVETWPRKVEKLMAMRDFRIRNEEGEVIGSSTSSWMVLDMNTRRPCKLDMLNEAIQHTYDEKAMKEDAPLLQLSHDLNNKHEHRVQFSEIDHNGHVNNTRYIDWCFNSLPSSFHRKNRFHTLTINYLSEVRENEIIYIENTRISGDPTRFQGMRQENGKPVFRAEILWAPRK